MYVPYSSCRAVCIRRIYILIGKTQEGGYAGAAALVQILSTSRQIPVSALQKFWIDKSCNSSITLRSLFLKKVVVRAR